MWDLLIVDFNSTNHDIRAAIATAREFHPELPCIVVNCPPGEESIRRVVSWGVDHSLRDSSPDALLPAAT